VTILNFPSVESIATLGGFSICPSRHAMVDGRNYGGVPSRHAMSCKDSCRDTRRTWQQKKIKTWRTSVFDLGAPELNCNLLPTPKLSLFKSHASSSKKFHEIHPFLHEIIKNHGVSSIIRQWIHYPHNLSWLGGSNHVNNPSISFNYVTFGWFWPFSVFPWILIAICYPASNFSELAS
jgi:hypothetical protein